jgi:hypothetical protein
MTSSNKPFIVKDQAVSFSLRKIGDTDFYYSNPLDLELFVRNDMWSDEWVSMEIHEFFYDDEFEFECDNFWNDIVQPFYKILKEFKKGQF